MQDLWKDFATSESARQVATIFFFFNLCLQIISCVSTVLFKENVCVLGKLTSCLYLIELYFLTITRVYFKPSIKINFRLFDEKFYDFKVL